MLLQQARDRVRSQHAPRIPRAQMLDGLIGQPAANRAEVSCVIVCKPIYANPEFPCLCELPPGGTQSRSKKYTGGGSAGCPTVSDNQGCNSEPCPATGCQVLHQPESRCVADVPPH